MSKIIVDQIATNGGDTFTLPAADGTLAKQPLVTDATGGLSFNTTSPLMPAADGTSGTAVITDGEGQLEYSANSMPAADGTSGQYLTTDGSGQLEFIDPPPLPSNLPEDSSYAIGMVRSSSARENVYSSGEWSSSGPWTTYYNDLSTANSITQAANQALGDGYPNGSSQALYSGDYAHNMHREKIFAKNKRMGNYNRSMYYHDNYTGNYSGVTWSMLPIRNNGADSVSVSLTTHTTVYSSSAYSGSGMAVYTPTGGNGNYAGTTGGAWTQVWGYTGSNAGYQKSSSVTVPAGRTVIVMLTSNHNYNTTYRFKDTHLYYGLDASFASADVVCDLRMLETLYMARTPSATHSNDYTYQLYPACAELFADR